MLYSIRAVSFRRHGDLGYSLRIVETVFWLMIICEDGAALNVAVDASPGCQTGR